MLGYLRGHQVAWSESEQAWRYVDTGELVGAGLERLCSCCGQAPTPEGHDACLGTIPGASSACCGHGRHLGYVNWPGVPVGPDWWRGAYVGQSVEKER